MDKNGTLSCPFPRPRTGQRQTWLPSFAMFELHNPSNLNIVFEHIQRFRSSVSQPQRGLIFPFREGFSITRRAPPSPPASSAGSPLRSPSLRQASVSCLQLQDFDQPNTMHHIAATTILSETAVHVSTRPDITVSGLLLLTIGLDTSTTAARWLRPSRYLTSSSTWRTWVIPIMNYFLDLPPTLLGAFWLASHPSLAELTHWLTFFTVTYLPCAPYLLALRALLQKLLELLVARGVWLPFGPHVRGRAPRPEGPSSSSSSPCRSPRAGDAG